MYRRDFGILFLTVCALYLSLQNEGPFTYRKAWYHTFQPVEDIDGFIHRTPTPPPVSVDLNGDGKPEVLTITPTGSLLVLAPKKHGDGFAPAMVLAEIDLKALLSAHSHSAELHHGPIHIVSFAVGHLTPPPKELVRVPRKQTIVLVTSSGDILVLDHNLKVSWHRTLAHVFRQEIEAANIVSPVFRIHEASTIITSHSTNKGDRGMVVVGARASLYSLSDSLEDGSVVEEEIIAEGLERVHARGRRFGEKLREVGGVTGSSGRHFSYYAYNGHNGDLRWKHEAEDFHKDLASLHDAMVTTQHTLHSAAQLEQGMHYSEVSCREFRESVLSTLPHSWYAPKDTRLRLAHFHRHRDRRDSSDGKVNQKARLSTLSNPRQRKAQTQRELQRQLGNQAGDTLGNNKQLVSDRSSPGVAASVHLLKRNHGIVPPNAIVAHVEGGMEAIHLHSGRTICRLPLQSHALHADINGDGIPDHVHAVGGNIQDLDLEAAEEDSDRLHMHHRHAYCSMSVSSGIPPRQHLFNGTICMALRTRMAHHSATIDVAPPIVLPVPDRNGHYSAVSLRQKHDVVFFTNRGDLTSYNAHGTMKWQVYTGMRWMKRTNSHTNDDGDDEREDTEEESDHMDAMSNPTLVPLPLRRHAVPSAVLAAGDYALTIVSEHGRELYTLDLPELPIQPIVPMDFNMDGLTDLVLVAEDGLYAWAQVRKPGVVPFSALVGGLIVIMLSVFVVQQGFMQQSSKLKKGRSTDRVD